MFLFLIVSCKKYNENDGYTTYSVKGRYKKGFWNCYKIIDSNNVQEIIIPKFSCILDGESLFGLYTYYYYTDGKSTNYIKISYATEFTSDKNELVLTPLSDTLKKLEYNIKSLTFKELILQSKITHRKYYFDKYITNEEKPIDIIYAEDKSFFFSGIE